MPLAIVSRNSRKIHQAYDKTLFAQLPDTIAQALHVPDSPASLTAKDIEIWFRETDSNHRDIRVRDFELIIFANHHPARAENLEERRKQIEEKITPLLPKSTHGYVWIFLGAGAFKHFVT